MNSLNRVTLIGNTTATPEVKETPNGQKVATFSLATNRVWKDSASGTKQEAVEFHNIVVWGNLAGIVESYLEKGKKVYIEGRLQTRSWDDPTGAKRYKTEIVADNVILLGSKSGERDDSSQDDAPEFDYPKSKKASPKKEEEINIEDIPFN